MVVHLVEEARDALPLEFQTSRGNERKRIWRIIMTCIAAEWT